MADRTQHRITRTALAVAAAAILAGALAGCDIAQRNIPTDGNGHAQACDIEVLEPVVPPDEPTAIESSTLAVCDKVPTSHIVTVYIEEELPGGIWAEVESPDGNMHTECTDLPSPGNNQRCARWVPCHDGHYRTRASVTGEMGDQPFGFDPPEKPDAWIRCPA